MLNNFDGFYIFAALILELNLIDIFIQIQELLLY